MSTVVELVTKIIEMDKELESLRVANKLLKEITKSSTITQINDETTLKVESRLTKVQEYALALGTKELAKKVLRWGNPPVIANRNSGDIEYTSFDKYADEYLKQNKEHIPPTLSLVEIKEFIREELMEKYRLKCNEAYENLLKSEQEESEDEE